MNVITSLAVAFQAWKNCQASGNEEWLDRWAEKIEGLCEDYLPHGSGFDAGTLLDFDASKPDRLVFTTSYHHMDEWGGYCGWSDHDVVVTPSLAHRYILRVTGRNVNWIKPYIEDVFANAFDENAEEDAYKACEEKSRCKLYIAGCDLIRRQVGFAEFKSTLNQAY